MKANPLVRVNALGSGLSTAGTTLIKGVTLPLVGAGAVFTTTAIIFEDAFAGVRKTVDATEEEFAALEQGIVDMFKVLPSSANEIAGVAESAGNLESKMKTFYPLPEQ